MYYFLLVNDLVPMSGDRSPAGPTQPCSPCPGTEPLPGNTGSSGSLIPWLGKDGKERCLSNISRQVSKDVFTDMDYGEASVTEIYLLGTHKVWGFL